MNRRLIGFAAFAAALAFARASDAQEPVDRAMIARIRAEAAAHGRAVETFSHFTNVIGPRLTGSPAHKQAAEYARARLAEWGMANVHFEPVAFGRGWTLEKLTLEMTAPRYFPLTGYPDAWAPSTPGVVTGAPVYLGDKTAEQIEAMGAKLNGTIVLVQKPQTAFIREDRLQPADNDQAVRSGAPPAQRSDATTQLRDMTPILRKYGAAVILRANQGEHGTLFMQSGRPATAPDAIPSIMMVAEHYNLLARAIQAGSPVQLRVEIGTKSYTADTNTYNVIAEIPGEDPVLKNEVVLLGGHLDSWHSATGATDNADAVSSLMEAMRILKALNVHPRRTIRLAIWSGEEQGLLGSRAYVAQHLSSAVARDAIAVYLNDDPGTGNTYGFYAENNPGAKAIFDAWLEPLREIGMKKNVIGGIPSTDHLSFTALGIPAFSAIKDYQGYDTRQHHTNVDFYERVDEASLTQSAVVMAVFAYHAAMRDQKFPRVPVPVRPPRSHN